MLGSVANRSAEAVAANTPPRPATPSLSRVATCCGREVGRPAAPEHSELVIAFGKTKAERWRPYWVGGATRWSTQPIITPAGGAQTRPPVVSRTANSDQLKVTRWSGSGVKARPPRRAGQPSHEDQLRHRLRQLRSHQAARGYSRGTCQQQRVDAGRVRRVAGRSRRAPRMDGTDVN